MRQPGLTYNWRREYGRKTSYGEGVELPDELQDIWEKAGMEK